MSFSSICSGFGIIKSNGNPPYTSNYERPTPNVKSLKVTKLGELGTTRKCTIELQAWTDEQLNEIAKCYFLPGMSVRVQFGWSVNASGAQVAGPITNKLTDSKANCEIFNRASSEACYDGFQGKIGNYQYSMNNDAGWDITLEIISAAVFVADSKTDTSSNDCNCTAKVDGNEVPVGNDDVGIAMLNILGDEASVKAQLNFVGLSPSLHAATIEYNGAGRTVFGEESSGFMAALSNMWDDNLEEPFLTVKAFHEIINKHAIPKLFGQIDTKDPIEIELKHPDLAVSADIRICYVPGVATSDELIEQIVEGSPDSAIVGNKLRYDNVMINAVYVMKCLKELANQSEPSKGISLQQLLTTIHTGINNCLGNIASFEILDASGKCDGTENPVLQLVDTGTAATANVINIEPAGSNSGTSIIREFNLETKLTDSMKSMALYAYTPAQGVADPCYGKFDAFRQNKATNLSEPKASTAKTEKPQCTSSKGKYEVNCESTSPTDNWKKAIETSQEEVTADSVGALQTARRSLIAERDSSDNKSCPTILPFEFSFTVDGIGGFKFGQYVTHPRIPESIRSAWNFQVTSVEHDISDTNDWKTTVKTVARFKPK